MSTWPPMAPLTLFLNCGFHYHHLPPGLSQLLPCARKLECSLENCLGQSPIPRHLLLPVLDCLPSGLASPPSHCSHSSFLSWPDTPASGSHRQSQDSLLRALPFPPGMFITKEPRTPREQMLPNISNHLALHRQRGPGAWGPMQGGQGARKASLWIRTGCRVECAGH